MVSKTKLDFITWLDQELGRRGWSDNQLAKRAGISHSVISKARSGSLPKWEACEAIAGALRMPPETVFRAASLLPKETEGEVDFDEWRYILALLPEKERYELLQIARLKLELQDREQLDGNRRQTRPTRELQPGEPG